MFTQALAQFNSAAVWMCACVFTVSVFGTEYTLETRINTIQIQQQKPFLQALTLFRRLFCTQRHSGRVFGRNIHWLLAYEFYSSATINLTATNGWPSLRLSCTLSFPFFLSFALWVKRDQFRQPNGISDNRPTLAPNWVWHSRAMLNKKKRDGLLREKEPQWWNWAEKNAIMLGSRMYNDVEKKEINETNTLATEKTEPKRRLLRHFELSQQHFFQAKIIYELQFFISIRLYSGGWWYFRLRRT